MNVLVHTYMRKFKTFQKVSEGGHEKGTHRATRGQCRPAKRREEFKPSLSEWKA